MKLRNIIFAATVFCLLSFSENAFGQTQTGSDGDWEFTYSTNDWTATLTKYRGASSTPTVPSHVSVRFSYGERDEEGNPVYYTYTFEVTALSGTFSYNGNITSVSIPSSITTLQGFGGCSNLVSISCAVPPKAIGGAAFNGCHSLKSGIDLSQCRSIGLQAFMECHNLEFGNLSLPNVTNIGGMAFHECDGLTAIELSSNLRQLDGVVFQACKGLQRAQVDGTDLVMRGTFGGCTNLQSVVIGDGVVSISPAYPPFSGCLSLRSLEVGTGVTVVSTNACSGLGRLETVAFRGDIQGIEEGAFCNCSNLVTVSLGGSPKTIGKSAFYNCRRWNGELDFSQCTNIGATAFAYCDGLSEIELPSCLQGLGRAAFRSCNGLTSARIDGTDLTLPCYVLADCTNLQHVVLGNGVTGVEENTDHYYYSQGPFHQSIQLKTLEVGTGMTAVSNYFCRKLSRLESVTFRGNVQHIGTSAFDSCSNLLHVAFGGAPESIGSYAFYECNNATGEIDLSRVASIGNRAFNNCMAWDFGNMVVPQATNIGLCAFYGCNGVESIELSSNLRQLDGGVFQACKGLQRAQVDGTDLVIHGTFDGCTNLQSAQIGNGVVSISPTYSPFAGCLSLRSLEVGTGVRVISTNACSGLGRLETASFRGDIEAIESSAFSACSNLVSLSLGGAPKVIGSGAFSRCQQLQGGIDFSQCTNVEGGAFYDCTNLFLGKLVLPKIQTVGANAFEYCRKLEQIEFSEQMFSLGNYAFEYCTSLSNVWFAGGVPSAGTSPFYQVASGAKGHYTAAHRGEWEGAIGSNGKWQGLIMREDKPKGCRVRLHRNGWKETLEEDDLVSRWIDFGETLPEKPFQRGECTFYGWSAGSPDFEWGTGLPGMGLIGDGAVWNPTDEEWDAWREKGWLVQEEDGTYCLDLYGVWGTKTKVVFYNLGGGGGEWLAPDGLKNHVRGQIDETATLLRNGESVELQPGAHSLAVSVGGEAAPYVATWSARTEPEVEWATTGNAATLACNSEDKFFFRIPGKYKYEGVLSGGEDPSANLTLYVRLLPPAEKGGMVKFDCQWKLSEAQMAEFAAFPSFEALKAKLRIRRMKTETEPEGGWIEVRPGETSLLAAGTYQLEVGYAEKYWNLNREATGLPSDGQNGNIVRVTVEDGDDKELPLFFSPFGDGEGLYYRVLFDGNEGTASEKEWWYRHTSGGPFGWTSGGLQGMPKAVREGGWMFAGWFTSSTGGRAVDYRLLTEWMKILPRYRILHAQWKPLDPGYMAWVESLGMTDADLPTDLDTDGDGDTNWEEYVTGTNPTDKNDFLETRMKWMDGKLVVAPASAVPSTGRTINVQGKKSMADGEWEDVTEVEDKDAEGWRFFRVGVKMAE